MDHRLAFLWETAASPEKTETIPDEVKLPVQCSFTHRAPNAEGEVELQYWPAREGCGVPPEQLTVFILGNPGLLNYYLPFLHHLHALLPPTHAILSTSHIGHSPSLPAPPTPLDLPQQLEAKVELVSALRSTLDAWHVQTILDSRSEASDSPGPSPSRAADIGAGPSPPRLDLMGHSVGAWMLCEVMKRLPRDVGRGFMLFPTVGWISESWNGRTLWPIFHRPLRPLLPILSPLLRPILPLTFLPPTTLALLRSPRTISACLVLARSEMAHIHEPDLAWFAAQAKSPEAAREHSELVAEIIAHWINPSIPTPPSGTSVESPELAPVPM
ncbi:hypothetical protein EHS25_003345 [Saitozyma podzolica]|uniref:AB hydrolase-1 domain-containing protein n=1 Tax=Saitozyma podzolica TaxID=1890683 RepID=A0A427Y8Q5_9TREE|nr:hypothetical protein EHS25_003345 [Saitozyma podzolica]